MKKLLFAMVAVPFIMGSCNKCHDYEDDHLVGEWKRQEKYANDHWGGMFYWQEANDGTGLKFTADGRYYRNEAKAGYRLIGTYKIKNNRIDITPGSSSSLPAESFGYELDNISHELVLTYDVTEGTTKEKFTRY